MESLRPQRLFPQSWVPSSNNIVRNVANSPESGYITVNTGKKNYKSQCVDAIKGEFFYNMMFKN